jgi:hypothetical protein
VERPQPLAGLPKGRALQRVFDEARPENPVLV